MGSHNNGTLILIIRTGCAAWAVQEIAWQIHQRKCQPYCLTCRWQTRRILCWFSPRCGCDRTNINYSCADSRPGSHSLFTAYHHLPCESYWKVNEERRDTRAAQTSCHSSVTPRIRVCVCVSAHVWVYTCVSSGGCNRRGCACHFLIIDNEAHWDCSERWRGNGKLMQSDTITIQVMMMP